MYRFNTKFNLGWLILLFVALFMGCEKWNLAEEVFLQVSISEPGTLAIDSVQLEAQLQDYTGGQIESHGFIWTTQNQDLTINSREGVLDLLAKTRDDNDLNFSAQVQLTPNQNYRIRAFASLDGREYIYSEIIPYQTGNAGIFTENISYDFGLSLQVTGRLTGMDKGFVALEHGVCWSTVEPIPTRADNVVNLGQYRSNDPFTADVDQLIANEKHYFRAYAVITNESEVEVFYGEVLEFDGNLEIWTQKASFEGGVRYNAVGFSIGDKGYMGTGTVGAGFGNNDFWEFDSQTNTWRQIADFEGGDRSNAVGFSIEDKGYVGTGFDSELGLVNDLWEYSPQTNQWVKKADLPAEGRFNAVGITISNRGYIGTGQADDDGLLNDWWEYNPQTNQWVKKADFKGANRQSAMGFEIAGEGFVGTGNEGFLIEQEFYDFWSYNPTSDSWTQRANFPGGRWNNAVAFSIGNLGYSIWGGRIESNLWSYAPNTDNWQLVRKLPILPRQESTGFSINQKGYFGLGTVNLDDQDDLWEYDP